MTKALPLLLALAACGSAEPDGTASPHTDPNDPSGPKLVPHDWLDDVHAQSLGEVEAPALADAGRPMRRMDIDQLNASLRAVTGGIGWEVNGVDQLEDLASTLGRPDYDQSTAEDLSPSLLFQKFLDDAANAACQELVDREATGSPDNVFLVHVTPQDTSLSNPDAVTANLQGALLRFHGHALDAADPQLEAWRWLFDTTVEVTGGDTLAGWRAVCIGLVTHPDFAMY
jgi:hypothetical protein